MRSRIPLWLAFGSILCLASPAARGRLAPSDAEASVEPEEVTPDSLAPDRSPPAPPKRLPPPPTSVADAPRGATPDVSGEWLFTSQYGWVYAPYDDEFVYTPEDEGQDPFAFVYSPPRGWCWLPAPWIWGTGPMPYFASAGAWRYHWYRGPEYRPRTPGRPLFHGGWGHGHWGGGRSHS